MKCKKYGRNAHIMVMKHAIAKNVNVLEGIDKVLKLHNKRRDKLFNKLRL